MRTWANSWYVKRFVEQQIPDPFVDAWHHFRQNELLEVVLDYTELHLGYFHVDRKAGVIERLEAQITLLKSAVQIPGENYERILVCFHVFRLSTTLLILL